MTALGREDGPGHGFDDVGPGAQTHQFHVRDPVLGEGIPVLGQFQVLLQGGLVVAPLERERRRFGPLGGSGAGHGDGPGADSAEQNEGE